MFHESRASSGKYLWFELARVVIIKARAGSRLGSQSEQRGQAHLLQ